MRTEKEGAETHSNEDEAGAPGSLTLGGCVWKAR